MLFLAVVSHEAAGAAVPQRWLPRLFLSHYSLGRNHRLPCSSCWIESTRLFIAIRPQALSHAKDSNIRSTCSFNSGYAYAVKVLFRYLGEVSEDALRQNFSTVQLTCNMGLQVAKGRQTDFLTCSMLRYLLLDEMIDSGLPFTTELNSLEATLSEIERTLARLVLFSYLAFSPSSLRHQQSERLCRHAACLFLDVSTFSMQGTSPRFVQSERPSPAAARRCFQMCLWSPPGRLSMKQTPGVLSAFHVFAILVAMYLYLQDAKFHEFPSFCEAGPLGALSSALGALSSLGTSWRSSRHLSEKAASFSRFSRMSEAFSNRRCLCRGPSIGSQWSI